MNTLSTANLYIDNGCFGSNMLLTRVVPYKDYQDGKPVDGVAGHKYVVVLPSRAYEMLEVKIPGAKALDLTDPHYLSKAHARYKNKILKNSFVFITSVLSPQMLWSGFRLNSIDSAKQFYRRIAELWEVTEDTIYIYKYRDGSSG